MNQKKVTTIKEIAKRLDISPSTVSRALQRHPSIGSVTIQRVQDLAKALNYIPNKSAVYFNKSRSYTIGVIVPSLSEPFFCNALNSIEEQAFVSDYSITIGQSHENADHEMELIKKMIEHRVDAIIISISKNTNNYSSIQQLENVKIPIVFFDRIPDIKGVHFVVSNLAPGMLQAINMLFKKGHHSIGLINGPSNLTAAKDRLSIYAKGLRENGLLLISDYVVNTDLTKEGNAHALNKLVSLKVPPTAIIVFNDYVLLDCRDALKACEHSQKEICLVGFSNLPQWTFFEDKPFASIEQFPSEQGSASIKMALDLIEKRKNDVDVIYQHVSIESSLVVF